MALNLETYNIVIVILDYDRYINSLLIVQRNPRRRYCERTGCIINVQIGPGNLVLVVDALKKLIMMEVQSSLTKDK